MRATVRRAELNTEIAERVAASIGRQPAKVIALRIGTSPRHVRGLQQRGVPGDSGGGGGGSHG